MDDDDKVAKHNAEVERDNAEVERDNAEFDELLDSIETLMSNPDSFYELSPERQVEIQLKIMELGEMCKAVIKRRKE